MILPSENDNILGISYCKDCGNTLNPPNCNCHKTPTIKEKLFVYLGESELNQSIEPIIEDIAIQFGQWMWSKPSIEYFPKEKTFFYRNKKRDIKELFETFKKEKGL